MSTNNRFGFFTPALLLSLAAALGATLLAPLPARAATSPLALETSVSTPIDVSSDGELLLLFLPGLQGFEIVNSQTGGRDVVSQTPCTGYFASISPDRSANPICSKRTPKRRSCACA